MADIELVIKIPEERYKYIQSYDWKNAERLFSEEWRAIHNGTPLPKGHGRLIDADKIMRVDHIVLESAIDDALTIIEADAESEDKV